jgi:P27 family predicted phage terminase small subunit
MGKRGPKPTPKPTLKIRGSWRAKQKPGAKNSRGGELEYVRPACPQWLTGDARKEWKRIIPILEKMGTIIEADRTYIALYCKAYAEYREAESLVKSPLIITKKKKKKLKDGTVIESGGNIIQHPALSIRNAAWERLRKITNDLGLSPPGRAGLTIKPKSTDNKKSRFFNNKSNGA